MAELWAGYLEKKTRSMFSGWQVRYFVLFDSDSRSATLKYWDTEKAYKLKPQVQFRQPSADAPGILPHLEHVSMILTMVSI